MKDFIVNYLTKTNISVKRFDLLALLKINFGNIITDRAMRQLVKEIVAEGTPIGSSEKGYFIVKTEEDREQVKGYVKKKIFGLWKFYNDIDSAYIKSNPQANPQLSIFEELEQQVKSQ